MSKSQNCTTDSTWIFGVCDVIARRGKWDVRAVRGVAALLALLIPVAVGIVYVVAAYALDETRASTQVKIGRWARQADAAVDSILQRIRSWQAETASSGTFGNSHGHK